MFRFAEKICFCVKLKVAFKNLQTGDENGSMPTLATINASAMVANGAESALPVTVLLSNDMPNVLNQKITVKTNLESPCRYGSILNRPPPGAADAATRFRVVVFLFLAIAHPSPISFDGDNHG